MPSTIASLPPFWTDRAGQFSALKFAAFCLCIGPALALAGMAATPGALGSKPLTFLIHETGELAVRFLLFSLAVTPLRTIADWPKLIMVRRMLGLTALIYVIAHVIFYVAEQAWNLPKVASEIVLRFYLTIGFVALLGLVALGVTSTDAMIKRLGAVRWNRLHALTYWITALALLHFFLQTRLDISVPVLMAGFFIWLMAWRWLKKRVEIGFGWMLALALFAALAAAGLEAAWYGVRNGAPIDRVLLANLDVSFTIRPALWVAIAGLGMALLHLLRGRKRSLRSRAPAPTLELEPKGP